MRQGQQACSAGEVFSGSGWRGCPSRLEPALGALALPCPGTDQLSRVRGPRCQNVRKQTIKRCGEQPCQTAHGRRAWPAWPSWVPSLRSQSPASSLGRPTPGSNPVAAARPRCSGVSRPAGPLGPPWRSTARGGSSTMTDSAHVTGGSGQDNRGLFTTGSTGGIRVGARAAGAWRTVPRPVLTGAAARSSDPAGILQDCGR